MSSCFKADSIILIWYKKRFGVGSPCLCRRLLPFQEKLRSAGIPIEDSKELFVHRDDLKPASHIQEPHLITGEYVEYEPTPTQDGRLKAINVSGIQRGPLMCDHGFK